MTPPRKLFKQFLDAMAHEHAPEFLDARQKLSHLDAVNAAPGPTDTPPPIATSHVRIGLILGSVLSTSAAAYAVESCQRLDADLVVYSFLDDQHVVEHLSAHLPPDFDVQQRLEIRQLSGSTSDAIQRAVNRTPRLQFLVCDAEGFTGHGVTHSVHVNLNVPIVAVTACDKRTV